LATKSVDRIGFAPFIRIAAIECINAGCQKGKQDENATPLSEDQTRLQGK